MGGFEHLGQINQFDKGKTVSPFKMKCFLSADTVSGPYGENSSSPVCSEKALEPNVRGGEADTLALLWPALES